MAQLMSIKKNVDVQPGAGVPAIFHCSQGDKGTRIILGLLNNNDSYTIPEGTTAIIRGSRADGTLFTEITADIDTTTEIKFNLTEDMTSVAGPVECEAVMSSGTANIIGTANFIVNVEKSPASVGSVFPGTDAAETWLVNELTNLDISDLDDESVVDAINSKLGGTFETTDAGKVLMVNDDGTVSPEDVDLSGKANESTIAPEFDTSASYTAGSYVLKNGVLYRFTSAHSGAWTGNDAVNTSVVDELKTDGQPSIATFASQMTDTNAIYLYLGEEQGYDYGYIYVYKDGAWTRTNLYGRGQDGNDGISPTANVVQTATGAIISITDMSGTTIASITNGTATDAQVETYVEDWLSNHPEATTTVEDGSITQEKLAFAAVEGIISSNLIDETKLTRARFGNANGSIQNLDSGSYSNYYRMTDYIYVSDHVGEYISVTNHNGYCFYTSSKTAISGSGESLGLNYPADSSTEPILIPSNAAYARLVYWYRDEAIYAPMANFGTTLDSYAKFKNVSLAPKCVFNENIGEKINLDNFDHKTLAKSFVSNNLIPPTNIMFNYKLNRSTGEPESVVASLHSGLTDWISVNEGTTYYGLFQVDAGFYDSEKNYIGYTNSKAFTTPHGCSFIRLVVDITEGSELFIVHGWPNRFYLVEGSARPLQVKPYGSYIPKESYEPFSIYKSVLNRLSDVYDPTIKTDIAIYGDSNTAGLVSGATGRYYENCWANLLCSHIISKFSKDVAVYAFSKYGSWYGGYYSGTLTLANGQSFASLDFYGSTLKVNFGQAIRGVASIAIDDGEAVTYDTNNGTQYIAEGLNETKHTVVVTRVSGIVQLNSFTVHKYITATNLGNVGSGTSYLPTNNAAYDIYLSVLGTNDRGSGSIRSITKNHFVFAKTQMQRGAKVIMITPTPATDGFETGASAGLKMADVEAAIAGANGICNLEHISFYQFLLNYCTYTDTTLNTLFNDTLHLTENAHKLIYRFMCDKLGLGQPIDDYL